jgi:hypothetical protein
MRERSPHLYPILFFLLVLLGSCSKGYEIRFSNFYIEKMDSVVIGDNKVVFTNIDRETSTEYKKIARGKYSINCVAANKKRFSTEIFIPGQGTGKRTVQIDAISQVSILEQ